MRDYRQKVHIDGKSIEDIMRLPCVRGCEKSRLEGYYNFTFYPLSMAHPLVVASTGDVLCEDYEGQWHVIRNGEELLR